MKTKILFSVLLIILITSLITVMGQEKTDKKKQEDIDQKKREQVTVIIDKQKDANKDLQKAMEESLAAEEKALKEKEKQGLIDKQDFLKQGKALEEYKNSFEEWKSAGENWNPRLNYSIAAPYRARTDDQGLFSIYNMYSGDHANTSLSISKSLEEVTFSTDFIYDVKSESSTISFLVTGSLRSGELKLTLKKPDKTAFQEFTISPLADVDWNQTFRWDEEESEGYLGKWSISISAAKATGKYRVQVNSR